MQVLPWPEAPEPSWGHLPLALPSGQQSHSPHGSSGGLTAKGRSGAPPTGPRDGDHRATQKCKLRVKSHTRECKQPGMRCHSPVTQFLWRRPELVPGSSMTPGYGWAFP